MKADKDIYVVTSEFDVTEPYRDEEDEETPRPIVFETYIEHASKENAQKFIKRLNGQYGKCRIAKLQFEEE